MLVVIMIGKGKGVGALCKQHGKGQIPLLF